MRTRTLKNMAVGACQIIPHLTGKFLPFSDMSAATLVCHFWQNLAEIVKTYVVYVQYGMESVSVRLYTNVFPGLVVKGYRRMCRTGMEVGALVNSTVDSTSLGPNCDALFFLTV